MSTKRILSLPTNIPATPSVDTLTGDALSIIELELVKFKAQVKTGKSLDLKQGRLLNGYVKSLTELSREDRERNKGTDLSNIPTAELLKILLASEDKDVVTALQDFVAKKANEPNKA